MIPTLLVADYLFVSKYSYGYTLLAAVFAVALFSSAVFGSQPGRGDVVVFRLPKDQSIDYIKRVVGLPGDRIQVLHGVLNINGVAVKRERVMQGCVANKDVGQPVMCYHETLPNRSQLHHPRFTDNGFLDNTEVFQSLRPASIS